MAILVNELAVNSSMGERKKWGQRLRAGLVWSTPVAMRKEYVRPYQAIRSECSLHFRK